jgi:hypothetical protein
METLAAMTIVYLAAIPFSIRRFEQMRRAALTEAAPPSS